MKALWTNPAVEPMEYGRANWQMMLVNAQARAQYHQRLAEYWRARVNEAQAALDSGTETR